MFNYYLNFINTLQKSFICKKLLINIAKTKKLVFQMTGNAYTSTGVKGSIKCVMQKGASKAK